MASSSRPMLTQIRFDGYKCFAEEQVLELKPLTILLGRNSAGKSAAARLPVLLAASMAPSARAPLDLQARGLDFGDSFLDLVNNREPHRSLDFELKFHDGGNEWTLNASVLGVTQRGTGHAPTQVLREWSLSKRDSRLRLKWHPHAELKHSVYTCNWGHDGFGSDGSEEVAPFAGLLIDYHRANLLTGSLFSLQINASELSLYMSFLRAIGMMGSRISYLGPFRARAERYYRLPPVATLDVGDEGQYAPVVLASDLEFGDGQLLAQVSSWFEQHHGVRVEVSRTASASTSSAAFSVTLKPSRQSSTAIALPDVGVGIAQVLPVVVQHFLSLRMPDKGGDSRDLLICEQPELHLHPAAHAALGDLFVETALASHTRVLVETHSENLILRVRRRVAEGRIAPESIALYWVSDDEGGAGSTLKRLPIERDGWVEDWPEGVFSEDAAEARALGRAARALQQDGGEPQ